MNSFICHERSNASAEKKGRRTQHPTANAAFGLIGAGLGAAAAAGVGPIIVPAAIVGGLAGYFLTNKIPA